MGHKCLQKFSRYFPKSNLPLTMIKFPTTLNSDDQPKDSASKGRIFEASAPESACVHANFQEEVFGSQKSSSFGVPLLTKENLITEKGVVKNSQGYTSENRKFFGSGFYEDYAQMVGSQESLQKDKRVVSQDSALDSVFYADYPEMVGSQESLQKDKRVVSQDSALGSVFYADYPEMADRDELELRRELEESIHRQIRLAEDYQQLKERYNGLDKEYQTLMIAVAEVKNQAANARANGLQGARYAKSVAAELSAARVERELELQELRTENVRLRKEIEGLHVWLGQSESIMTNLKSQNKRLKKLRRKHLVEIRPPPDDEFYDAPDWIADFDA